MRSNWELGSDFHWDPSLSNQPPSPSFFNDDRIILTNSGRSALVLLFNALCNRDTSTVFLPSYFCIDIPDYLRKYEISYQVYPDNPLADPDHLIGELSSLDIKSNDLVVVVDYFGTCDLDQLVIPKGILVADVTHRPAILGTNLPAFDFLFASLRKSFPLADGGAIRVNADQYNRRFLARKEPENESNALERYQAMIYKSLYLNHDAVSKSRFRPIYSKTESKLATVPVANASSVTRLLIETLDIERILSAKQSNVDFFWDISSDLEPLRFKSPVNSNALISPFSILLYFDSEQQRDSVRSALIENNIYPFVLWPISEDHPGQSDSQAVEFSLRMLGVHADYRYTHEDMRIVSDTLRAICSNQST